MFLSIHRLEYVTSWFHTAFVALMYRVEVESRMQVRRRFLYCNGSYSIALVRNQRRRLSSLCVMVLLSMSTNQFSAMDRYRSWTNQWIKILSWGDNSLTEFYVSLTIEANEKKQLAYWGEQNWLIKVFMFIYNS